MSSEASAEQGAWDTSRAEYQRGIMDAISDPTVTSVAVRTSSQVGKTEMLLNAVGYFAQHDPAPILFIEPTLELAMAVSKDRISPMFRDSIGLSDVVRKGNKEDTILHKNFLGGHLTLAGANSPASLSSRPVRVVVFDEVDRYPASAGAEGDPMTLGKARSKNYWNRKHVEVSSPSLAGFSRIDQSFLEGDQRHFHVPCPHCGVVQALWWKQVKWNGAPSTARYHCDTCEEPWTESQRHVAVKAGHWIASAPFLGKASFHLNELYSPWSELSIMVSEFLDAKHSRNPERMKAWTNTTLGQSYSSEGETVDAARLADRTEKWEGMPTPVLVRTLGIDIQDDRAEMEFVGWGDSEESWSLGYNVIHGDPSTNAFWNDVASMIEVLAPDATAIDSGGHFTQQVYAFARKMRTKRVYAIKGINGPRPVWPNKASKGSKGGRVYLVGVDSAKEIIQSRFKLNDPGPGYCHFPDGREVAIPGYFQGLDSEIKQTKWSKGFPYTQWVRKPGSTHNEPWDCRVYAYAALVSLGIKTLEPWRRRRAREIGAPTPQPGPPDAPEDRKDPLAAPLEAVRVAIAAKGENNPGLSQSGGVDAKANQRKRRPASGFVMGWKR